MHFRISATRTSRLICEADWVGSVSRVSKSQPGLFISLEAGLEGLQGYLAHKKVPFL